MNADRLLAFYERIADAPDAIVRFRRFILDLAVRGKLVEQDLNDEPALKLLKQIASEKARLVKTGKIKKQKIIPTLLGQDMPYPLPVNWRWSQIAEIGVLSRRCCTARSKSLTSLCRLQSHPAQYVSGIPSAAILLSISHPIRCSTRCLANVRARISGPMIAL